MMQSYGGITGKDTALKNNLLVHHHILKAKEVIWTTKGSKKKIKVIILFMKRTYLYLLIKKYLLKIII